MSLIEPEAKVLENIWEFVQEGPQGFTHKSFCDLVALFKEHWQICFVKNVIRQTTMLSISHNLQSVRFSNSIRHKNLKGLWLLKTTSKVIEDTVYNPNIVFFLASREKISFSSIYYILFYVLYTKCKYFDMQDMTCIFISLMNKYIFFIHMSLVLYKYIVNTC